MIQLVRVLAALSILLVAPAPAQSLGLWTASPSPALLAQSITTHQASSLLATMLTRVGFGAPAKDELARADALLWPDPTPRFWPMDEAGAPRVATPTMDSLTHTLRPYQGVYWLRDRYKVSREALQAWNPGLDLDALEPGQEVVTWRRDPDVLSRSVGAAMRGRLLDGEPLPPGPGYAILYAHRAFGTYYTVSELQRVLGGYAQAFPEAEPLMVGDVSYRTGRRILPHLSHTSGRDVDITYPRHSPTPSLTRFHRIRRHDVDMHRTLWLLRALIEGGSVAVIFIDRPIQRGLYTLAKEQGAPQEWLDAVFQYPRWGGGDALVRDSPGHDDHFHVRFICQPTDLRCQ